ncbi:hypothetical protein [Micromonospora sp. NPDC005652]|uniref:hypothetical protein n=1 Tax=Micromonospora sp. NPDC005652 TaxID=3157046 RepID=UPI0033DAD0D2
MISIPTYNLVGMTADVLPFAPSARTDRERAFLRYRCDGRSLEVSTYDDTRAAVATWTPPEVPGGLDEPWEVLISTSDAKDLANGFKLTGARANEVYLTVESVHGDLVVTRKASDDEKLSVSGKRARYTGSLDAILPHPHERYADLGERAPQRPVDYDERVAVPLGKACKRTGQRARLLSHDNGLTAVLPDQLVVFWRYPVEVDQDAIDADAIVTAALETV